MSSTDCMIEKARDFKADMDAMESPEDSRLLRSTLHKALVILLKAASFYKRHEASAFVGTEQFIPDAAKFIDELMDNPKNADLLVPPPQ